MLQSARPSVLKNAALGVAQILLWGGSYFMLSVLATPIMKDTGWSYQMVFGALSLSLLISGLILPYIGTLIQTNKKNLILQYAGIVIALGLVVLGLSQHFIIFLSGWTVIGIGMGMGLYDALFASIGKMYGSNSGKVIVQVTLISSLAPTITWTITSLLLSGFGWRNTCFIYAAVLILTILPLHRFVFSDAGNAHESNEKISGTDMGSDEVHDTKVYYLLLVSFTIGSILTTGIVIHLMDILLSKNITMATALGIVAFLGPSQAGVRVLELILPKRSPIKMSIVSAIAMLTGVLLLFFDPLVAIPGVILFGMGNGLKAILRGTLPLSIFGQKDYAALIGKLGRWPLIAQAVTPFIGGILIQQFNMYTFLFICCLLAATNIVLCLVLRKMVTPSYTTNVL